MQKKWSSVSSFGGTAVVALAAGTFLLSSRLPSAGESDVIGDKLVGRVIDEPRRRPGAALDGVPRIRDGARRHRRAMTLERFAPVVRDIPPLGHHGFVSDHHDDGFIVRLVLVLAVGLRGRVARDEPGEPAVVFASPPQRAVQPTLVVAFSPRVIRRSSSRLRQFGNLREGGASLRVVPPSVALVRRSVLAEIVARSRRVAEPSLARVGAGLVRECLRRDNSRR